MEQAPKYWAHNFEFVGYHDLKGTPAFKLALDVINGRWYLYTGTFWTPHVNILDVTDPENPVLVNQMLGGGPNNTSAANVNVANGIMVLANEKLVGGWGYCVDKENPAFDEGIKIYDLRDDPANPKLLSHWKTNSQGTHRNHFAGDGYIHASAYMPGYHGMIYVILDVSDLRNPHEIGRWFVHNQFEDGGGVVEFTTNGLHGPAQVVGNRAYLPYGNFGAIILDISDYTRPRLVSRTTFGSAFSNRVGVHTFLPLIGTNLALMGDESITEEMEGGFSFIYVVDISDEKKPRIMAPFPNPVPTPEMPFKNFQTRGGKFGPHNWIVPQPHNPNVAKFDGKTLFNAWFNAGLRAFDISDPYVPVETGFFLPADPLKRTGVQPIKSLTTSSEDIIADSRGYIYMSDKNHGIFIVKYTG